MGDDLPRRGRPPARLAAVRTVPPVSACGRPARRPGLRRRRARDVLVPRPATGRSGSRSRCSSRRSASLATAAPRRSRRSPTGTRRASRSRSGSSSTARSSRATSSTSSASSTVRVTGPRRAVPPRARRARAGRGGDAREGAARRPGGVHARACTGAWALTSSSPFSGVANADRRCDREAGAVRGALRSKPRDASLRRIPLVRGIGRLAVERGARRSGSRSARRPCGGCRSRGRARGRSPPRCRAGCGRRAPRPRRPLRPASGTTAGRGRGRSGASRRISAASSGVSGRSSSTHTASECPTMTGTRTHVAEIGRSGSSRILRVSARSFASSSDSSPSHDQSITRSWSAGASCASASIRCAPAPETDWYVETRTRASPASSCSGLRTQVSGMVQQFGLATMRSRSSDSSARPPLTSGTTSG